jgi:Ca2+-binding RTX toxin-like protein
VKFIGTNGNDNIVGTSGDDYIDGGAGEDWLYGGQGNDIIYSLGGITPDHIDGGDGTDTAVISREYYSFPYYNLGTLTLDLSSNQTQMAYMPDGTTIIRIEQLQFYGGSEQDVVTGGIGSNILDGGDGDDILTGGNQADQLDGGDGFDALMGRGGDDTLYSFDNQGPDYIDGGTGTDLAWINRTSYFGVNLKLDLSKAGGQDIGDGTIINNIEKVYFWGGSGNDTLTGGALDDQLNGGLGSDHLDGGKGNDVLNGGDGNDFIYSRANEGFDAIDGGTGNADFVMIDRSTSGANLYLDLSNPANKQDIGDDVLWSFNGPPIQLPGTTVVNVEQVEFHGGSGNDFVVGGALKDMLFGGTGNDQLFGGGGDD